jgi:hypothetical protein
LGRLAAVGSVFFGRFESILQSFFVWTILKSVLVCLDLVGISFKCVQCGSFSSVALVILGLELDTLVGIFEGLLGISKLEPSRRSIGVANKVLFVELNSPAIILDRIIPFPSLEGGVSFILVLNKSKNEMKQNMLEFWERRSRSLFISMGTHFFGCGAHDNVVAKLLSPTIYPAIV